MMTSWYDGSFLPRVHSTCQTCMIVTSDSITLALPGLWNALHETGMHVCRCFHSVPHWSPICSTYSLFFDFVLPTVSRSDIAAKKRLCSFVNSIAITTRKVWRAWPLLPVFERAYLTLATGFAWAFTMNSRNTTQTKVFGSSSVYFRNQDTTCKRTRTVGVRWLARDPSPWIAEHD